MSKSNSPSTALVVLAFLAVYLIWGSTYLGIRFAIDTLPPFFMAGARFLVAGSIMFGVMRWRGAEMPKRIHWRNTLIVGGLMLLGGNGLVTWAEQYLASGLAAVLVATVPLWIVIFEWIRTKEYPSHQVIGGLLLGFGGVVFLVGPANLIGDGDISLIGVAAIMVATFSWGLGSIYSRQADLPSSPLVAVSMEMLGGGALLIVAGLLNGESQKLVFSEVSTSSFLAWVYLVTFGSMIGFTAYVWLLKVTTPARASTYAYVNPAIAVLLGWSLGDEALTTSIIVASVMIIGAVVLITTQKIKRQAVKTPLSTPNDELVLATPAMLATDAQ